MAREVWTSLLEAAGLATVSAGAAMIYRPAGLITAGLSMVAIGFTQGGR
ncbi:MAG: hypothetical protein KA755_09030 [Candidatus Microthrix sp.]|nr:hypothetical protein [Candidatus Microthrix sp.]